MHELFGKGHVWCCPGCIGSAGEMLSQVVAGEWRSCPHPPPVREEMRQYFLDNAPTHVHVGYSFVVIASTSPRWRWQAS